MAVRTAGAHETPHQDPECSRSSRGADINRKPSLSQKPPHCRMLPRPASLVLRRPSAGPRALNQRPGRGPLPVNDGGSPTLPETTGTGTRVRAPVKRRRGDRPRAPRPRDGRGPQPLRRCRRCRETGAVTERGHAPRARTRQALSAVAGTCHRDTARARAGRGGCRVQRDPAHQASRLGRRVGGLLATAPTRESEGFALDTVTLPAWAPRTPAAQSLRQKSERRATS